MFRKLLQASSPETHFTAPAVEQNNPPARPSTPGISERSRNDSFENAMLSSFEEIYHKSCFRAAMSSTEWDIGVQEIGRERATFRDWQHLTAAGQKLWLAERVNVGK
jgi:hypothetical protein